MKYPLIIAEGWDLVFYNDVRTAELNLESIDVGNQAYKGFDSDARELLIETVNNRVTISASSKKNEDELTNLLYHYLDYLGVNIDPSMANDFRGLLDLAIRIQP